MRHVASYAVALCVAVRGCRRSEGRRLEHVFENVLIPHDLLRDTARRGERHNLATQQAAQSPPHLGEYPVACGAGRATRVHEADVRCGEIEGPQCLIRVETGYERMVTQCAIQDRIWVSTKRDVCVEG